MQCSKCITKRIRPNYNSVRYMKIEIKKTHEYPIVVSVVRFCFKKRKLKKNFFLKTPTFFILAEQL